MNHLGKESDGTNLDLDLETLMRGRLLVTASSGAGKTGTLLEFCELNAGRVQIFVIDPEGEFAVLRQKYPFVLVGPEGETPAMVRTAGLLATRLLELGASAILDIYEMPMHQKHEFVREFVNAMIDAPKKLWRPVIVIVDEAHMWAPEKGQGESVALGAMADLASRGRKRGYCAVLATQRLAKLSKNVAAECQNVLVGRTTHVDQARAADVLNISGKAARDEFAREIGRMPTGDFFAYGMAFSREMPTRFTVHKAETMPKAGTKRLSVPPAPHEIQALLPQLADLPAEAEAKAKTVADLQREIADLRKQLRAVPQSITPARERMLLEQIAELQKTGGAYEKAMTSIGKFAANLKTEVDKILEAVQTAQGAAAVARPAIPAANPPTQAPVRRVEAPVREKPAPNRPVEPQGDLTGPEQRVLNSLAWFEAIGVTSPELPAVAFMAGYTVNGSFHNVRGKLRGKGLVVYVDGGVTRLTEDGRNLAQPPDIQPTNAALHDAVLSRLDGPGKRVLQPLIDAYPNPMTNEELATAASYTVNGSFHNVRGRLRSLGLVRYESGSTVANALLFPEG